MLSCTVSATVSRPCPRIARAQPARRVVVRAEGEKEGNNPLTQVVETVQDAAEKFAEAQQLPKLSPKEEELAKSKDVRNKNPLEGAKPGDLREQFNLSEGFLTQEEKEMGEDKGINK